jgi:C4-dicarboxylate-binding protein DctP
MIRSTSLTLAAFAAAAFLGSPAAGAATMRCSHQLPPGHHIAKVIDRWAAAVHEQAGEDLEVQVFGANSLVGAKQNIVSVAKGDIECAFSVNFQWGKTLPIMNVTLAPFAFGDIGLWRKWPDSEAAAFLSEKLLAKGVRNVTWLFTTNTSVFTSKGKALVRPADFEGVKIRGLVPAFNDSLAALGAAPSSMSGSKVYQALATGVIDAGVTDVAAAVSRKYYEVQDHFTVVPVISVYFHGYVNPKWRGRERRPAGDHAPRLRQVVLRRRPRQPQADRAHRKDVGSVEAIRRRGPRTGAARGQGRRRRAERGGGRHGSGHRVRVARARPFPPIDEDRRDPARGLRPSQRAAHRVPARGHLLRDRAALRAGHTAPVG